MKALTLRQRVALRVLKALNAVYAPSWSGGPWYNGAVLESDTFAWQQNIVVAPSSTLLSFSPIFSAVTGIASDIAKMRIKLSRNNDGIWEEITSGSPWLPLLEDPNHFQNQYQFIESWMLSKLLYGNAYVLKHRQDRRGLVTELYVLHPECVKPLVADNGDVYYQLSKDDLSRVFDIESVSDEQPVVPASEIIHDRFNCLWHKLIGVSPLYACGNAGTMGAAIQANATNFFSNRSLPGGMLTAPGEITNETATRLKTFFESNFSGTNIGKLFVAGDGLKFDPFSFDAQKSQQVEQLQEAAKDVARAFHYPIWKLTGVTPPYTKPDQAQVMYYSDCLQPYVKALETALDKGLALPDDISVDFEIDDLMRMDRVAQFEMLKLAEGILKKDEQRAALNRQPLPVGGDTVYLQEQNFSVEALAKRDAQPDPFASSTPAPKPAPAPEPAEEPDEPETRGMDREFIKLATKADYRRYQSARLNA